MREGCDSHPHGIAHRYLGLCRDERDSSHSQVKIRVMHSQPTIKDKPVDHTQRSMRLQPAIRTTDLEENHGSTGAPS